MSRRTAQTLLGLAAAAWLATPAQGIDSNIDIIAGLFPECQVPDSVWLKKVPSKLGVAVTPRTKRTFYPCPDNACWERCAGYLPDRLMQGLTCPIYGHFEGETKGGWIYITGTMSCAKILSLIPHPGKDADPEHAQVKITVEHAFGLLGSTLFGTTPASKVLPGKPRLLRLVPNTYFVDLKGIRLVPRSERPCQPSADISSSCDPSEDAPATPLWSSPESHHSQSA